jgi:16S rRNA (uracil1498-N3)-methyltransferase
MASLPLFFYDAPATQGSEILLDEDTSKHVIQVLRMKTGDKLALADGKGARFTTIIVSDNRKKCSVQVTEVQHFELPAARLHLAVGFTKNASRNEWLLEKATELGVCSIIPLNATRTEKEHSRFDRWHNILVSAMLQSQQYYLPALSPATSLMDLLDSYTSVPQKLIGHCDVTFARHSLRDAMAHNKETIMLIGPEGDFTPEEIRQCMDSGYTGVSMATQRLRTETAALNVCAYFNTMNHEAV